MSKKALLVLADGFEETEAITCIDILRRANIDVTIAGLNRERIRGAHLIIVFADTNLNEINQEYDALVLPGGMPGASNLAASAKLQALIQSMDQEGKIIAAICAAPAVVLAPLGILRGRKATCYPDMKNKLDDDVLFQEENVVVDGNIITSRGVGTAIDFALTIVEHLTDKKIRDQIQNKILVG